MSYLLDTNTCIQYLVRRSSSIATRMAAQSRSEIFLCDVVKAELYYGAYKSTRRNNNLVLFEEFFNEFMSLPFDGKAAKIYGEIRMELESRGIPIGPYDLQIAAIALSNNLTLVTHNVREFSRVVGLRWEDWEV
ncbi:type II toxin-antitoxin system VapC family toxin [Oscillatoria sp. FACHB-1406]|uniref:type II toxin-antitoxin system tRNA(fMet)-specific endonuclease VapC n=1 Tax=Oscillatoria sp. FACHB-1406 TaxID=2692846 RepID=UPI001687F04D|nr:type II toxin-antitoxin system VapC family toxin [Oscillatoria sp. FACHB-1406]MBD2579164.1 type II toxin-antitoxin system VapC family toxin [Oscillatoria sp. FACHB-1406]